MFVKGIYGKYNKYVLKIKSIFTYLHFWNDYVICVYEI